MWLIRELPGSSVCDLVSADFVHLRVCLHETEMKSNPGMKLVPV